MERHLKERLTGATVLILLGVIFIPMVLDNSSEIQLQTDTQIDLTNSSNEYRSRIIPVDEVRDTEDMQPESVVNRGSAIQSRGPVNGTSGPANYTESVISNSVPSQSMEQNTDRISEGPGGSVINSNSSGLSGWIIQLGSFSSQANAEGLVSKAQAQGYPAYIEELIGDSESIYRVRVGPELNREDAEKLRDVLFSKLGIQGIILNFP